MSMAGRHCPKVILNQDRDLVAQDREQDSSGPVLKTARSSRDEIRGSFGVPNMSQYVTLMFSRSL
jgi:hypothetical protein